MPAPPIPTKCSLRPDQGWSIPVNLGPLPDESPIDRVAREAFGYSELRPGQREAIESALAGHDALVVMSTGSGKSAIYQIAGLLTPGATVVVSPLIAL
jgi:ATP-dependent DNA helicase RecQ